MTEAEVKKIVAETVKETLTSLGVDMSEPLEVQRDMAHLRRWRGAVEKIPGHAVLTAIGILTAGVLALAWMAVTGKGGA